MGFGEYSAAAHAAITATRVGAPPAFSQRGCHPLMNPRGVAHRESRDSEDHPESLAVLFALDVTGSMVDIPRRLAQETLPHFMQALTDAAVLHPQVCFMAVGHAGQDRAPLQVGQFESTAHLIDQWLTRLYLEGGGVGGHESYELAMYFAAHHIRADCALRRGRRGYLFLTVDTAPNPAVARHEVREVLGQELTRDIPIRELLTDLQRSFEPFVLLAPRASARVERAWRDLLGDRVVRLEHMADTALVAAGLVSLLEGAVATLHQLVQRMSSRELSRRESSRIAKALVPFASSIGRDSAPDTASRLADLPRGDRRSGMKR